MIKRLMKSAVNILVFVFARQFCGLFGISGEMLTPCTQAARIVSFGMVFCSAVSLIFSNSFLFLSISFFSFFFNANGV